MRVIERNFTSTGAVVVQWKQMTEVSSEAMNNGFKLHSGCHKLDLTAQVRTTELGLQ